MFTPVAFWQTEALAPTTTPQPLLYGLFQNSANASAFSTYSNASLWTTSTPGLNSGWYRTHYSETRKLFMAVSETGPIIRSSFFTQSWTQSTSSAPGGFRDIKFINELNLFIACGITNTAGGNLLIRTSTDGVTFVTQSTPVLAGFLEDIVWSGGTAVCMSQTSRVITSNNGTTWTSRTAATGQWHGGAYSPSLNRYVIGGINGYIGYSSNAISWTVVARTGNWRYFAWSPTLNIFVGTRVGSSIAYSSDGISWTASTSGTLNWWNVIWVPEQSQFLATAITSQTRPVWRSSDGINWTQQTTVLTSGTWVGFAYRKEIL